MASEKSEVNRKLDEVIEIIKTKWTFDSNQHHTHTWHDYADTIEAVLKLKEDE